MLSFKLIIVVYFVVCRDITTVKYICEVSAMGKILGIAIKTTGRLKILKWDNCIRDRQVYRSAIWLRLLALVEMEKAH